jgi:uncharacterized membrane protein (DUF106 family)
MKESQQHLTQKQQRYLAITFFPLTSISLLPLLFFSLYCYYSSLYCYYSSPIINFFFLYCYYFFPIALILFVLLLLFSHGVALFLG